MPNKVHIAGRGSVVRQLRLPAGRQALRNPPRQHVPTVMGIMKNKELPQK